MSVFFEKRNELGKYLLDNNSYFDLQYLLYKDIREYLFYKNSNIFELPTKELINVLKGIILDYFQINNDIDKPVVLELGAGIGLLTYLLKHQPELKHIEFIATDPFTSYDTDNSEFHQIEIEKLNINESLDKYSIFKPLVIWSWVPLNLNATDIITNYPIDGIIYIGEYKLSCGTNDMFKHQDFDTNIYNPYTLSQSDTFKVRHHSCVTVLTKKELEFDYKHQNLSDIVNDKPYKATTDELLDDIFRSLEQNDNNCIVS